MMRYETYSLLLIAGLLVPVAGLTADSVTEKSATSVDSTPASSSILPALPAVGMSMKAARELLQLETMNEELVGGACGMLQILTSEDESIRIIGVGGVVTSVNNAKDRSQAREQ